MCECGVTRGLGAQLTRYSASDNSGTIDYDEFKNVFRSTINDDSIPFDFDWCVDNAVGVKSRLTRLGLLQRLGEIVPGKEEWRTCPRMSVSFGNANESRTDVIIQTTSSRS